MADYGIYIHKYSGINLTIITVIVVRVEFGNFLEIYCVSNC